MGLLRRVRGTCVALFAGSMFVLSCAPMQAQVSVTTWRYDTSRTGQNLGETTLAPSNVNATQFGKLFSQPVDGYVYAEPLYMPSVVIGGTSHNVVFVATEHDSVYAFDADSNSGTDGSPLWFASMLSTTHGAASGATSISSNVLGTDIIPEIGITGTPVIDPASGTLYVVSATEEGANFVQRLHALDITSGAEKFGGPVVITASVPGTGNGSVSGTLTFDSEWQNNRAGLLLLNGIVYLGFASHGDNGPWHGWIMGYNAQTLKQTGVFCTSPNGTGGGVWMGGEGLAAEIIDPVNHPYGRMFVATGNGDYTATKPYAAGMDYGDSVLDLDLTNGVPTITDEFTPAGQAGLDQYDGDQGSAGILILPPQTTGSYPHLLVQAGKSGEVYLLNRDNLGGYNPGGDQVVQELPYEVGSVGTWTSPAYWNNSVYYWAQIGPAQAFPLSNGKLVTPPLTSNESYNYPGANPVISANGNSNAVLWTIDSEAYTSSGSEVLQAHDPTKLGAAIYSSSTNSSRDNPGGSVKFSVPTVANGKVYVGSASQLSVYGLLNSTPTASAPVLNPGTETFAGTVQVSMTEATPSATVYYTLDGTTPTVSSTVYSGPITLSATTTVQAMAIATGYLDSPISSDTYTDNTQVATPIISPVGGTYTQAISATITDSTSGATIYYTTDGSTPTTSSTKYTGPVTVTASETLSAIAAAAGFTNSAVVSANYTLNTGGTTYINYAANGFSAVNLSLNNGPTVTGGMLQVTDGGPGEDRSAWFATPVPIGNFITDFTFQQLNATADGMTFTIQNDNVWALGYPGSGLGSQSIPNSVTIKFDLYNNTGEGNDSTGIYLNGAIPTVPSIDLTSTGVNLHSGDIMHGQLIYDGQELTLNLTDTVTNASVSETFAVNIPATVGGSTAWVGFTGGTGGLSATQNVLSWSYVNQPGQVVATPTFSPAAGTYTAAQSVTINESTAGATVYYTTNGTTPTTSSSVYSSPITVSSSETVQAIGVESGFSNSGVASAAYTISNTVAAPTISPAGGTYTTTQAVTISDATSGATIYYTTNGTTPTTSSAVYGGPITVSSSETIEAMAAETGYTSSPVTTAVYTISPVLPAPTFSPAAGTYTTAQSVAISDSMSGTTIYYTTNGTTPTTSSTVYSGPVTVSATETLEAMAAKTGYTNSPVATAAYTIAPVLPAPTFSPAAGNYTSSQTVTISDATSGTTIYYTTNGTTPTTSSTKYKSAIAVSASETVEAIAVKAGYTNSPVATAVYTISTTLPAPTFSPTAGTYTSTQSVTISDSTSGTTIYYTTNGTTPTTSSTAYTSAVAVSASETLEAIAVKAGYTNSPVATAAYTINPVLPTPTFTPAGGTYTTGQSVTIGDSQAGTTIYYTTNGTTPTTSSTKYTGAVTVSASETLEAIAVETGYTNSAVATAAYTISPVLPAPTFSPVAGSYTTAQSVTISDSQTGTTIYYTTNGTTPTTSSTKYTGAVTVSSSETLEAIAVETGYTNSPVGTAAYTINLTLPAPTFSPAGGTYTTGQSVTIGDSQTGTTIYYTTNGTTPTTSSTKYTGPVAVGTSETLEAIAVETGYTNSPVGTAAYTINLTLPAPTFSPAGGTYTTGQSVTIGDTTTGTTIYYTTNGTTPTTSSTKYTTPVTVGTSETLEAIAVETGYTNSPVATAAYTITPVLPAPTFSPTPGTYTSAQTVTIGDATPGTAIYYTTNGTTPTSSSALYSIPIAVGASETLNAIAIESGYANSPVATGIYTISTGSTTYINYPSNGITASSLSLNYGAVVTGGVLQLTDGGPGEVRSAWYDTPVPVNVFTTDFTFQQLNATADGMTFTIQGSNIWALGYPGSGLGSQGIGSSVSIKFDLYDNAGEGSDSTGIYTNGAIPTVPSIDLTNTGINLHSGDLMHAHLVYDGTNLTTTLTDTVTNAAVTEVFPVNIPSIVGGNTAYMGFTGATGGFSATQNVVSWSMTSP